MGIRPYAADCGALVLPLASKVKLRTPSNGSEQFCMLAVCSLCCRLTVYNFQHIRLRSLDRLGMTDNCFRTRRKVSECPPPQEFSCGGGVLCRLYFEYKKKTSCNFVSAVLYCPCRVRQGRFFCRPAGSCAAGARKEPLSVERMAKRAARRAPFARHVRLFMKNALRFSGGCAILKQPYKLNTTHRCGIGISYLFFL